MALVLKDGSKLERECDGTSGPATERYIISHIFGTTEVPSWDTRTISNLNMIAALFFDSGRSIWDLAIAPLFLPIPL